jgi:hypothetical protein
MGTKMAVLARIAFLHAFLHAFLLTAPSTAFGQVNAEVMRPNPFREGWSGSADGSFALNRGNVEIVDVGAALRVQYQTLHDLPPSEEEGEDPPLPFVHQRIFLTGTGRYAERSGASFVNQTFFHFRWTGMWHERIGSDFFLQQQSNEFQRLRARDVVGLGARFELVHDPVFLLWSGSGYMFEYNRIDVLPGAPDKPEDLHHRWTNFIAFRIAAFKNQLLMQNTLYVQPRWDDFSDVRVLEEFEAMAKVTDMFSMGTTLGVLHDNAPPTGVRPTDLRLLSTLRLSL